MSESRRIRVLVVDDHEVLRSGVAFALLAFDDLELVGEAPSGEDGLGMCGEVRPDVVLLDMLMPGIDGVDTARAIRDRYPEIRVLVLSNFFDTDLVQRAAQAGVVGYLVKEVTAEELAEALRAADAGRPAFSPDALKALS
jgi:NarL family two-component system response regulator LiaR